jgi:hypothetical protein
LRRLLIDRIRYLQILRVGDLYLNPSAVVESSQARLNQTSVLLTIISPIGVTPFIV